jgi:hypothetical protein
MAQQELAKLNPEQRQQYEASNAELQWAAAGTSKSATVVTDVHMPFMSMVTFMVKWAFAAIPAMIIIGFFVFAAMAVVAMLGGSLALLGQ